MKKKVLKITILILGSAAVFIFFRLLKETAFDGENFNSINWNNFSLRVLISTLSAACAFPILIYRTLLLKAQDKKILTRFEKIRMWLLNVGYWLFAWIAFSVIFNMEKQSLKGNISYFSFMAFWMGTIFYFIEGPMQKLNARLSKPKKIN